MGIYIYTLRTKPLTTAGEAVYQFKYSARLENGERGERQDSRLARYAETFTIPDTSVLFIVGGDSADEREGAYVYRAFMPGPVWYDCDAIPGAFVGVLRKQGREWRVVAKSVEEAACRGRLQEFWTEHGIDGGTPERLSSVAKKAEDFFWLTYGTLEKPEAGFYRGRSVGSEPFRYLSTETSDRATADMIEKAAGLGHEIDRAQKQEVA